ncbi:hypothetical protein HPP92_025768 [Vanilla planifolia]|uniref:W2 domain-containing protein n=1 Tax=Vanilla planifolia TaxID=51239 RepID=A0A835U8H2_VANPL|nr:hypothetical protein HPP92_026057 [Vanilla planifolia]KAG0452303.1 hypothetical protein HPP92_026035 [Vanilla planifolia]KAG0452304.1 hypothetical protein HPP92_025768 [Vanilla planifolia]
MAFQNIGASNRDDAFYRYKMPKMITKIEGRGNGIKTNIVNMVDVAKALARPASYTTKYFGCELGAQSKFDDKTGTSLVNGAHDAAKLAGLLENFIKKYVQCYGCGNPETEVIITKTQMITLKCAACGYISDVDMRDKLTTFILKNPPEQKKGSKDKKGMRRAEKERLKEGEAADEEQKKLKKEAKKKVSKEGSSTSKSTAKKKTASSDEEHVSPNGSQVDEGEVIEVEEDVQWQTDASLEAARQRIQEQLTSATAEMVMLSTNEEEKPKHGKKSENSRTNGTVQGHKKVGAHDKLVAQIRDIIEKGSKPGELAANVKTMSGSSQELMTALFEALFDGTGKGFAKEVAKKKKFIAAAVQEEVSQLLLLRAVEAFCEKCNGDAIKEVALAVKALYDADVLEEDFIVQWYEEGIVGVKKDAQLWKNMKPLVEWLQNAESESGDE